MNKDRQDIKRETRRLELRLPEDIAVRLGFYAVAENMTQADVIAALVDANLPRFQRLAPGAA